LLVLAYRLAAQPVISMCFPLLRWPLPDLWLGETPSVTSLLGGALAVAGVIIVSQRR